MDAQQPQPFNRPPLRLPLAIAIAALLATLVSIPGAAAPDRALAAKCPGASDRPERLSSKRARSLILCLVNKKRAREGVARLRVNRSLGRAASRHTRHMQRERCFAHVCPGEPSLSGRLKRAGYLPCGCSWNASEALAFGYRRKGSPRQVFKAWMRSSPHRRALLGSGFRHIGIGFRRGDPWGSRSGATYTVNVGYKR